MGLLLVHVQFPNRNATCDFPCVPLNTQPASYKTARICSHRLPSPVQHILATLSTWTLSYCPYVHSGAMKSLFLLTLRHEFPSMPYVRRLDIALLSWKPGFNLWVAHVQFIVDHVAVGQNFITEANFRFLLPFIIPPMY
jgi:hypothetical protein